MAPVEIDDLDNDESEGDIISRVVAFFKKEPEAAEEEAAQEAQPEKTYFPPSREVDTPEPAPEPAPEPVVLKEEPAVSSVPHSEPERDLFSMPRPVAIEEPEPFEEKVEEHIEQKIEEHEEAQVEDAESGPTISDVMAEKLELVKEVSVEVWRRFQQVASELALDLKIEYRKLLDRLPDIRALELSWNSIPVLVTLLLLGALLIFGLASMIGKTRVDPAVTEEISVVEPPQEKGLRIVVNPPEPYYK